MQKSKLQSKIQKYLIAASSVFVLFVAALPVFAAEIFLDAKNQPFAQGEEFLVQVYLNTEGESINAVEGKLVFPPDFLEAREILDGNSIISFWIERPRPTKEIAFSGIIPGGYIENKGLIFSAVFYATKEGEGIIEIHGAKTLLNDGKGTEADVKISNLQFNIKEVELPIPKEVRPSEIKDSEPPETFRPEIAKDESLFGGKWFLVFATQDKSSGIDRYEVKESRQIIFTLFQKWVPAESPYILGDQELRSFVFVKAVDKNGNKRIIQIAPRNPFSWYENYENWIIIITVVLVVLLETKKLWRKKRI